MAFPGVPTIGYCPACKSHAGRLHAVGGGQQACEDRKVQGARYLWNESQTEGLLLTLAMRRIKVALVGRTLGRWKAG